MRISRKRFIFLSAALPLLALFVLAMPPVSSRLAVWAVAGLLADAFGVTLTVEHANLRWWPLSLELRGVALSHPRLHPVRLSRVDAEIDAASLWQGGVHIPLLHIQDIAIDKRAEAGGNVLTQASDASEKGGIFPDVNPLPIAALVEAELPRYDAETSAFREFLEEKQTQWSEQLQGLPGEAELATHRQRLSSMRAGIREAGTDAPTHLLDPVQWLDADIARFLDVDKTLREDWQRVQNDYAALKAMAEQSVERIFQARGLAEPQLATLGQWLMRDTLQDWFARGLGFHEVLSAHDHVGHNDEDEGPIVRLLVRKVVFEGQFEHGSRQGTITGEMLNLSNVPARLAEPLSLHLEASGDNVGDLQLSVLLDHRPPDREADRFNFSLQKTRFARFVLADNDIVSLELQNAVLNVDMAGTITQQGMLDLSLSSVFNTQSIDVRVKSADSGMAAAMVPLLAPVREVTLAGLMKGSLARPDLRASTNLDDVLAPAARTLVASRLSAQRSELLAQLTSHLQRRLVSLEQALSQSSAMVEVAKTRAEPFRRLRNTVAQ